jgi:hypothetical protein
LALVNIVAASSMIASTILEFAWFDRHRISSRGIDLPVVPQWNVEMAHSG